MPLPLSAVMPTLDRPERALRTVAAMLRQSVTPAEVIVVDASAQPLERAALIPLAAHLADPPDFIVLRPPVRGAAAQRNHGIAAATQPFVLFLDDDIDPEPGCLALLWESIQSDPSVGASGVVITNQHYHPPGRIMRRLLWLAGCPPTGSLAGLCCGPALNFLPALPAPGAAAVDRVDWANLCFTLFRREALPPGPLHPFFHGYSLMEDAAITLEVAKQWKLHVPAHARIFHDIKPAAYKDRAFARERMEMINRWFVLRHILGRDNLAWDLRHLFVQFLMLALSLRSATGWRRLPAAAAGKIAGLATVFLHSHRWRGYNSMPPA